MRRFSISNCKNAGTIRCRYETRVGTSSHESETPPLAQAEADAPAACWTCWKIDWRIVEAPFEVVVDELPESAPDDCKRLLSVLLLTPDDSSDCNRPLDELPSEPDESSDPRGSLELLAPDEPSKVDKMLDDPPLALDVR